MRKVHVIFDNSSYGCKCLITVSFELISNFNNGLLDPKPYLLSDQIIFSCDFLHFSTFRGGFLQEPILSSDYSLVSRRLRERLKGSIFLYLLSTKNQRNNTLAPLPTHHPHYSGIQLRRNNHRNDDSPTRTAT